MTKTPSICLLIVFVLVTLTSISESRDRHVIKFRSPGLYPEGLTYDRTNQHFIVASLRKSTFHSISDAAVTETLTLTSSPTTLPSNPTTLGLTVDHRHNRLLAAVNTAASPYLAAFSLHRNNSLSLLFLSPLPTDHPTSAVANAVAVDPYGNAYVTNSGENLIWKVTLNGTASILSNSSIFHHYPMYDDTSPYNYCGLNGVVYVKGREYLLVVQTNTGKMFKVDIVDGTARSVILPFDLPLADGIAVREDGVVFVVSMNQTWMVKSDDSWAEGVVIDKIALDREGFPTSVTVGGGGRVYVVYGYVEEGGKVILEGEEREWFRIEEIRSDKESEGENVWLFVLVGFGFVYFLFWRFQMKQLVKNMDKKHN